MAIDPEDLAIFKVREEKASGKSKAKKARPAKGASAAEPESNNEVKAPIEAQKPASPAPSKRPVSAPKASPPQPDVSNVSERYETEEEKLFVSPEPTEDDIERIMETEAGEKRPGKRRALKTEAQSREMAKGLYCAWHPWRSAYALCSYCHRAFCYEDLIENKNRYYCLEDIDKVSTGDNTKIDVKYNNLSVLSGSFFLIAFMIFLYFANGQLDYIFRYANQIGFFSFISTMNYSYATALVSGFVALFGLIAGLTIFAQSNRGFVLGILSGIFGVALFSYEYLYSSTMYTALVGFSMFLALVFLIYSREALESETLPEEYETSRQPVEWPNVSRF